MELPAALRAAIDRDLEGVSLSDLARGAAALSARYRAEARDGRLHLADERAVLAYGATRLPGTFAAIRAAMTQVARARPAFSPASLLDIGAGPGTALWAAREQWPSLGGATLLEASEAARISGERWLRDSGFSHARWSAADIAREAIAEPADLVTLCYVLDELEEARRAPLIARLWFLTKDILLLVEPGTSSGWRRLLAARAQLIAAGAHLLAPCPHAKACPLLAPDWCHFARRVARSRLHRLAKQGDVPWEDEKFIYLAASRRPGVAIDARVIAPPRLARGQVALKSCEADGAAAMRDFSRRDGAMFRSARRAQWGEALSLHAASR